MASRVEICGVDTSRLPVIPEQELAGYFQKIYAGDKAAREEFIRGNLRLVLSIVQRFSMRGENMDDLFQIGCIGLMKAVDHFKLEMNVRFSTYAVPMIIGEIRRYLRDNNLLRVSRSLRDTAYRAYQVKNALLEKNMQEPTIDEIAREMGMRPEEVVYALDAIADPVSLSQPIYQDGEDTLYVLDSLSDDKFSDERWLSSIALSDAVSKLNPRERSIIYLRYFAGKTQMEVSREIGISQAQVSRLKKAPCAACAKRIRRTKWHYKRHPFTRMPFVKFAYIRKEKSFNHDQSQSCYNFVTFIIQHPILNCKYFFVFFKIFLSLSPALSKGSRHAKKEAVSRLFAV
ncbi:MAG: RNA polymerase sporulation sigma factor SigG [Christensenellaceae bacterium]